MALEAVAQRTLDYPYKMWGFGEGMALLGLLRAGDLLRRKEWIDFVAGLVAPTLHTAPSPLDHLIPLEVLFELKRLRPALDIADATQRFVRAATDGPHRPDLEGLSTQIWVDCLHTDGPGLVLAGHRRAAAAAVELGCARFQDDSGLFSHGFDVGTGKANATHWGRGQGWALHGLTAVHSPNAARLLVALEHHEEDGCWRTIVDDPAAPVEHSVSALVASAVPKTPMGQRALRAALAALDSGGGLPVSSATPVGSYLDRETGVFPWGQGPLLLALLERKAAQ
jgi:rhamnogalacturonyl hydrolase YesR